MSDISWLNSLKTEMNSTDAELTTINNLAAQGRSPDYIATEIAKSRGITGIYLNSFKNMFVRSLETVLKKKYTTQQLKEATERDKQTVEDAILESVKDENKKFVEKIKTKVEETGNVELINNFNENLKNIGGGNGTLEGKTTIYNPVFWSEVHYSDLQNEDWNSMPAKWKNVSKNVFRYTEDGKEKDGFYSLGCKQLTHIGWDSNWYGVRKEGCNAIYEDLKQANPKYIDAVKIMSDNGPFGAARQRDKLNEALYSTTDYISTHDLLNKSDANWAIDLDKDFDKNSDGLNDILTKDYYPEVSKGFTNPLKSILRYNTGSKTGIPNTFVDDDDDFNFYIKNNSDLSIYDIDTSTKSTTGVNFKPTKVGKPCPTITGLTLKKSLWNESDVVDEAREGKILDVKVDKSTRANPSMVCSYKYDKSTPQTSQTVANNIKNANLTDRHYNENIMPLKEKDNDLMLDNSAIKGENITTLETQLLGSLCADEDNFGVIVYDRFNNQERNCANFLEAKGYNPDKGFKEFEKSKKYCEIDYNYVKDGNSILNFTKKNLMPACAVQNIVNFEQKVREIGPNESIIGHYQLVKEKYPNTEEAPPGFKEVFEWMDGIPEGTLESLKEHLTVGTIPSALCSTKLDPNDKSPLRLLPSVGDIDCTQDIQICDIDVKLSDVQVGGNLDLENECKATPAQATPASGQIDITEDEDDDEDDNEEEDDDEDEDEDGDEDGDDEEEAEKTVTVETKRPNIIIVIAIVLIILAVIYFVTRQQNAPPPPVNPAIQVQTGMGSFRYAAPPS